MTALGFGSGNWNHRVMRRISGGEIIYAIFEVYYADSDVVLNWDVNPCAPLYHGDTEDGGSDEDWSLRQDYDRMAEAFDKPVLDYETGLPVNATLKEPSE